MHAGMRACGHAVCPDNVDGGDIGEPDVHLYKIYKFMFRFAVVVWPERSCASLCVQCASSEIVNDFEIY